MATSKKRNKKYAPKKVELPHTLLKSLPVPEGLLSRIRADFNKKLLRLRLSGIEPRALSSLAIYAAQAWIGASEMSETKAIRAQIESCFEAVNRELKAKAKFFSETVFESLADVCELMHEVFKQMTVAEFVKSKNEIANTDSVMFMVDVLVNLTACGYLEGIKEDVDGKEPKDF